MQKRKTAFTLFKRTIPYIKKEKKLFFINIVLTLVIAVLSAITPFITKAILDDYLPVEDYQMVTYALILYGVIFLFLFIFRYLFQYLNTLTGMKIEKRIREEAMRKIDYLKVDYYSLEPDGKIVSKITSDSNGVRTMYTTMFSIFSALVNIIIVYTGIIILNPMLAILVLILVPILSLWITLYRRKVHSYFVELRETGSRITGKLNELISGTLIIQDFNQEEAMLGDYKDLVNRYNNNDKKANTVNIYFGWELISIIKRTTVILLLMYLGFNSLGALNTTISIGLVGAFVENIDKMVNPINAIFNSLNELEESFVSSTRVYMFIDEENDLRIFDGEILTKEIKGDVEFKNIRFAYTDDKYVLDDVSFKVKSGMTVGIVGSTGSGKSSLMNLLLAYNDYQSGSILIDGDEITKYNKASYRKNLGIVLQTPALFAGTLRTNVTMGNDYSDEEVIKVLNEVGASHILNKTELGLDMPISFRGGNLSLGEKQLICFARILLRNPKILVLDEATSNIDSETEVKIKKAMDIIARGRTTFIIAHRLSTIKNASIIYVLENGKIIGSGDHLTLLENNEVYKKMYYSQFQK